MAEIGTADFMLGCVARLTMAAILLLAALHGFQTWATYREIVVNYHVMPRRAAILAAWLLPPLQLAAAAVLLVGPRLGAMLGLALIAAFTFAVVTNLARGRRDIDCGCGGADGQTLSLGLVVRNLVLMLLLTGAALAPEHGVWHAATCIGIGGSTIFALTLYFAANQLLTNWQRLVPAAGTPA